MRNRAKCKACEEVIESFHRHDYVSCKCGQIAVDGGTDCYRAAAKDWTNFVRVDDDDREIEVTVIADVKEIVENEQMPLKPSEPAQILDEMIQSYEHLPQAAMMQPATNADVLSILLLFRGIFQRERP